MAKAEQLNDSVTLYEGDCLAILPTLTGIDAVISDPPYGMNWDVDISRFSGGHTKQRSQGKRSPRKPIAGDEQPFDPSPWLSFPAVVLFGANHFGSRLPVGTTLVWVKRNPEAYGSFLSDAEIAWMKGGHGVYCHLDQSMNSEALNRKHPSQKPIDLMRWCIQKAKVPEGDTILDPFAGSGTTGIAAMMEGRKAILIERDPKYCDIIRRRVERFDGQQPGSLFRTQQPALC